MTSTTPAPGTGLTAPFAVARFRDGDGDGDDGGTARLGLVAGERIRALDEADLGAPDLNAFLAAPDWDRLGRLVDEGTGTGAGSGTDSPWRPLAEVTLTAPVQPRQVVQAGANYRTHVIDLVVAHAPTSDTRPEVEIREDAARMMDERAATGEPYFFIGLPAAVVGDDVPLVLPSYSEQHDWELELAVVIGREGFRITPEEAMDHVAGYTICNDITTRDRVFREDSKGIGADWYRSKNAPGFLPTGPFLVPAGFVEPHNLAITLDLNGERMQDAVTSDLLFDVPALISAASLNMPLLPGDLLLTGSPAGNGAHWGRLLRDGDVMEGSVQGLGTQRVRCIAESAGESR
ncbi:fumarylacetoacetate hydrolase family protein [Citricoccus muralis]|uniref:2-keto-4-pentenoate hydratase/2-oxohepta-3-ene-1,7-dioic acid hydratase in catechol pathway n=1 Tax=Citricoccus muralis TaxID=169134 RepID=A0A3D9LFP4_9MICC|nr:fumarylacetoacetate hydrolase family protein [Citricoccus muralis]REE04237.1 2-keto-4-pentenoate hydratase/2-oxohepta-3-ene-1,7-dioic acid hydratase in catechol pathway [Citricoccus muralis]